MQFKRRLLNKTFGFFITVLFGGGIKNSCINQPREYVIKIILKWMPVGDSTADFMQSQLVIDILKKKIAAIKT
ncbi:MAG: hypothetical protein MJ181_12750, partial [Treponema sp.]|nr:hypothetical protein [Treponema sp.]